MELADIGKQTLPEGEVIDLPPLVFAQLGTDPAKKTVLIYGHLDVQPAAKVTDNIVDRILLPKSIIKFIFLG